jgi:hypothetical protein
MLKYITILLSYELVVAFRKRSCRKATSVPEKSNAYCPEKPEGVMLKRVCSTAFLTLLLTCGSPLVQAQSASTIAIGAPTIAQIPSPLSLEVRPAFDLPIGDSANWFSYGGGIGLDMDYEIPGSQFFLTGGLEYSYAPDQASTSLSLAAARFGGGVQIPLTKGISIQGFAVGGYYFTTFNDLSTSASDPYAAGGIGLKFSLGTSLSLNVTAQYEDYLGLYQGLSAGAGIGIALGNLGGSVDIPTVDLRPAFPVFYKYYDDHPIGTLELKSNLKVPATNMSVQVYIREFMDAPKEVKVPGTLAPGASVKTGLYALFTDKVLNTTEGTKVAAEISVAYTVDGQVYQDKRIETLTLTGRNAMTWDDNRKAAAYVSANDPGVLNFARSVASYVQGKENRSISENLQAGIAIHEALDIYGLNYTPNPKTPYSEVSKQKDVIDFVQFPRETFQYHAGDCSDISILYAALLQAVGVDAAFITIPGHIFIAFDSGLTPEKAPQGLIPEGQFISYKGKAWIPVEITSIHEGFLFAWGLGAKEWNENTRSGLAGFYPVQEAWAVYQSVGLPGTEITAVAPAASKVLAAYQAEVQKQIDAAIGPQVAKLQEQVQANGSLVAKNGLGVLYAKYGQLDKAEREFKEVVASKHDLSALLNLGHLYFAKKDWNGALGLYQQASELDPGNSKILLALARVNLELKQYDDAKKNYEQLKTQDPGLASQFAYLGEGADSGTRAANIESERGVIIWETGE